MELLQIDNIMYRVSNLEKSEEFYLTLGLKKAWEDKTNKMIGFTLKESDSEIVIQNNPALPKFDYSYLVSSVHNFLSEYKNKGYIVSMEPIEVRCGYYAVLSDPDGNNIPIIDLTKFDNKPRYD